MTLAPLRLRTKMLWSTAGLGAEALTQSRNAWLVFFYAPPADADRSALLSLTAVTLLLFAGKFIEAFDDVLIGFWSDRTVSRWGRRVPFIVAASPPMALFAFLMFVPPAASGTAVTLLYLFVTLELFFLFSTLSGAPYEALMPEIARTTTDRVSLAAWRTVFGVIGAAIGLVGSGLLISAFGFGAMALTMAALSLAGKYAGVVAVWHRVDRDAEPVPLSLRESLQATFSNRAFVTFVPSYVLFGTALTLLIGLLPFYVSGILRKSDEGLWVSLLTAVGIGAMAVSIPFFVRLAHRRTKQQAYRTAMLMSAAAFPLLAVSGLLPGVPTLAQVLVLMVIVGAPLAGVFVFPAPILADICDDDARRVGMRREGAFFGAMAFCEKLSGSFAPLLLGLVLLLGNTAAQPLGIRMEGPLAGALVVLGYLTFRGFVLETDEAALPVESGFALAQD